MDMTDEISIKNIDDRTINILGTHNKYLIKRANKETKKTEKVSSVPIISHYKQQCIINQIFMEQECEYSTLFLSEIQKKINGYKQQDKKKGMYCENLIITKNQTIEKLMTSKLVCRYCKSHVCITYNNNLEKKQWTLDRIYNDIGHTRENVVICCLECNIKRGKTDMKKFEFTKSLKLIKKQNSI